MKDLGKDYKLWVMMLILLGTVHPKIRKKSPVTLFASKANGFFQIIFVYYFSNFGALWIRKWIQELKNNARIFVIVGEKDAHLSLLDAMTKEDMFENDCFVIGKIMYVFFIWELSVAFSVKLWYFSHPIF